MAATLSQLLIMLHTFGWLLFEFRHAPCGSSCGIQLFEHKRNLPLATFRTHSPTLSRCLCVKHYPRRLPSVKKKDKDWVHITLMQHPWQRNVAGRCSYFKGKLFQKRLRKSYLDNGLALWENSEPASNWQTGPQKADKQLKCVAESVVRRVRPTMQRSCGEKTQKLCVDFQRIMWVMWFMMK